MKKDLRGTWGQAIGSFGISVLMILAIRWALFEPYVIPSGSMIPTLLVHDYILVNKFAYGVRLPFTNRYLFKWHEPQRGDVVVFKNTGSEDYFLVKRLIGLPGDEISFDEKGFLKVNSVQVGVRPLDEDEMEFLLFRWSSADAPRLLTTNQVFMEKLDRPPTGFEHVVMRGPQPRLPTDTVLKIPAGEYFMMGDNRENSSDSRVWGTLPFDHVLGRAAWIWLSCEETLPDAAQVCDPRTLRFPRLFSTIH